MYLSFYQSRLMFLHWIYHRCIQWFIFSGLRVNIGFVVNNVVLCKVMGRGIDFAIGETIERQHVDLDRHKSHSGINHGRRHNIIILNNMLNSRVYRFLVLVRYPTELP